MERFLLICQQMEWSFSKLASGIVADWIRKDLAHRIAVDDADARYLAAWGKNGSEW